MQPLFSIIIPVYNESQNLPSLFAELQSLEKKMGAIEIIAIDDGSTDESLMTLRSIQSTMQSLRIVSFSCNYGQTAAIAAGIDLSTTDIVIPIDADGQNNPDDIPILLEKLHQGYDIVSGWRHDRKDGFFRTMFSHYANFLLRMCTKQPLHDYGCTLKAYKKSTIINIELHGDMHRFLPAYAALQGVKIAEIKIGHRPRMHGVSKYGLNRIWKVFLDILLLLFLLRSLTRPMQFFGGIGLQSIFCGIITIISAIIWRGLNGPSLIETPLPILSALLIIVGVQCILMGLIAEIMTRIYLSTTTHKLYTIRNVFESSTQN